MYYVYIVECKDGTLYTGITTDVKRRFQEHKSGKGGSYTSSKKISKLVFAEECRDRSAALKREAEIKGWRREKKLSLIKK
jgi:putative endonuclease